MVVIVNVYHHLFHALIYPHNPNYPEFHPILEQNLEIVVQLLIAHEFSLIYYLNIAKTIKWKKSLMKF